MDEMIVSKWDLAITAATDAGGNKDQSDEKSTPKASPAGDSRDCAEWDDLPELLIP